MADKKKKTVKDIYKDAKKKDQRMYDEGTYMKVKTGKHKGSEYSTDYGVGVQRPKKDGKKGLSNTEKKQSSYPPVAHERVMSKKAKRHYNEL